MDKKRQPAKIVVLITEVERRSVHNYSSGIVMVSIFMTKTTVYNRDVSIRSGSTVLT